MLYSLLIHDYFEAPFRTGKWEAKRLPSAAPVTVLPSRVFTTRVVITDVTELVHHVARLGRELTGTRTRP